MVTVNEPRGLDDEVTTWREDVRVLVSAIVTALGVKDAVEPVSAGVIDAENETLPTNPPLGVTVIPYWAVPPGRMLRVVGDVEIAKVPSGGGGFETVTFTDEESVEAPRLSTALANSA